MSPFVYVAFAAALLADFYTSRLAIRLGAHELNPLLRARSLPELAWRHLLFDGLLIAVLVVFSRHQPAPWLLMTGIKAVVSVANLDAIRKLRASR